MIEAARSITVAITKPQAANFPASESATGSSASAACSRRCFREANLKTKNVAAIEAIDGIRKVRSQVSRGGRCPSKTTIFAGLEIGRTKLAAFAIKAQANKYGRASTFAFRTAAYTAGVRTTAVASLERNTVTIV